MDRVDPGERLAKGLEHYRKGELEVAGPLFEGLLAADPGDPNAANLLGLVRKKQGRPGEAESLFRQALRGLPEAGGFHNNLGSVLRLQGRMDEAMASYREALRLEPGNADACLNLTRLLRPRGDYLAVLALLEQGIRAAPGDAELWSERGEILSACGDAAAALDCHRRALALDPRLAASWAAYGSSLLHLGDAAGAIQPLSRSLELDPARESTASALLMAHQYAGEISPSELAERHRDWVRRFLPALAPPDWTVSPDPGRRLRLGILSPDLRTHSVAAFLVPFLRNLNPDGFELIAYSATPLAGETGAGEFRPFFSLWRDVAWLGGQALADLVREDGVDILMELAGHTEGARLDAVARRPAPIQVFWLGYPGSTGLEAFQARLTDAWVDPPGEESLSAEVPLRLPRGFHCYLPDPEAPEVSELPALRTGGVTFASFNNLAKLNSPTLRTWAALLRRLPGSRLVMKSNRSEDPFPLERIREQFLEEGVAPSRIQLLGRIEAKGAHLAQYNQVDLALDPFPYNGVTTTCEAMWMGVPVITLLGDRQAGRYGASLLAQAGMEAFIARSPEDYLSLAMSWAKDLPRLAELRAGLRDRLRSSALLDAKGFSADVEGALRRLWRDWCAAR